MASFFPPGGGGSSGVSDVDFPLDGTGAPGDPLALGPGLNPATIFVSPLGSNTNDGLTWNTAVKNGYNGYALIVAAGGGTLNIASGTEWGGPVAGQGAWFRGDGFTITGWQAAVPCNVIGYGSGPGYAFSNPGEAFLYAGSNDTATDYRTKPAVWFTESEIPITFTNIRTLPAIGYEGSYAAGNFQAFRIGWDYNRNDDGTIQYQAISSSTRTGTTGNGSTVHTVALTPAVTVGSASRTSNVTTLVIFRPGNQTFPPWAAGTKIYFNDTSGFFNDGGFTVTATNAAVDATLDWSISFVDAGADVPTKALPGTVRSITSIPGDLIDVQSNNIQFASTQFKVTATSITNATTGTVTVFDPWGGYGTPTDNAGPIANIGQLTHQERGYCGVTKPILTNCTSRCSQNINDIYKMGPMFDFGGALALTPKMYNCYMEGFYPTIAQAAPYDDLRMVSCLVHGGVAQSPGLIADGLTGTQSTVRVVTNNTTAELRLSNFVLDTNSNTGEAPACYIVDGDSELDVFISNIIDADAANGFGNDLNRITGVPRLNLHGDLSGFGTVGASGNAVSLFGFEGGVSPWIAGQLGTWADGKINGKHPAAWRGIAPAFARFSQLQTGPGSWHDAPTATNITGPYGNSTAVSYDDTAHASVSGKSGTLILDNKSGTFLAGDKIVIAGWFNYPPGLYDTDGLVSLEVQSGNMRFSNGLTSITFATPFIGGGWQWVCFSDKLSAGSGTSVFNAACWACPVGSGGTAQWDGITTLQVPTAVPDNDAYEFIGTLKAQPYYLAAGMAGTMDNQKFIAHGGSGIATGITKVVGGGSGQLVLTGTGTVYEPRYDADGTTILGWVALLQATVNP